MTIKSKLQLARSQWDRYTSAMERGHTNYQKEAKENENYYLGRGRQWDDATKAILEAEGKPWLEENIIFSTVNTVLGYQTQSRMDIAYKPREAVDQNISDLLTKIGMFIVDENKFPWVESQVFSDGCIQQRGYLDIRMKFDDNMNGDVDITALDPLDVIPDPDAKSYDPDDWNDVMVTQWLSLEDIKITYGAAKYREALKYISNLDEADFGADEWGQERNRFADTNTYNSYYKDTTGVEHLRLIERQWYKLQNRAFWYDIETGDLLPCPDDITTKEKNKVAKDNGYEVVNRLVKRVRWTVSTRETILHDAWSPYDHFTIIPFFPYFRRGKTLGLVDNLIKSQEMLNKVYSQMLHVVNTTANSGWIVDENSLTNMETDDLEDVGGQTGLILEVKQGRERPDKIEPNIIPAGLKDMVGSAVDLMRLISGVSETFQGGGGPEVSGVAIQSRVHQAAIQLATPIDNLFRTRNLLASRLLKLIQQFYTEERIFLISSGDTIDEESEEVAINQESEEGSIINDVTVGKYDVVIADVPTQITFQNAQFSQAVEMRKFGVKIPDEEMIMMSTLSRKNEIAKKVSDEPTEEQAALGQEQMMKQIEELDAKIEKLESDAGKNNMDTAKQAADIAVLISDNPSIGPIIDRILNDHKEEVEEEEVPELQNDRVQLGEQ